MDDAFDSKAAFRHRAAIARREMSADDRNDASLLIFERAVREAYFRCANGIAIYLPTHFEVNTWPLIERAWQMKKRVFAPVVQKNHSMRFSLLTPWSVLRANRYGVAEPNKGQTIGAKRIDVVFMPLVAFDEKCNRIGMGSGYFDRAFSFARHRQNFSRPKLVGLAFDCQRVEHIPASPWDIPLFQVITESRSICRR